MSLELLPLATMVAELRPPKVLPRTPAGTRMIYEVVSGHLDGERLRAKMSGVASADWLLATVLAFSIVPVLEAAKWMARRGWFGELV